MKIVIAKRGRCPQEELDNVDYMPLELWEKDLPWLKGEQLLFMDEIKNMPGHGVYCRKTGETFYGYHTDDFIDSDFYGNLYLEDFTEKKTDLQNNEKYFCLKPEKLNQLIKINFINKDLLKTFEDYDGPFQ